MGSLLSPPGIDPSKSWELTFDNNQDGVRSFHSQFNTIIDEMYEESLKYS